MSATIKFTGYCSTPLLLLLQPSSNKAPTSDLNAQTLPFKAYEPTIEIRDRKSRSVYIEVPYNVETGEAERIAVDWTARGGGGGTTCKYFGLAHVVWVLTTTSGVPLTDSASGSKNVA
jgi:hypothetical protein